MENVSYNLRRVFASVMVVYTVWAALFSVIFYFTYSPNIIISSSTAMDVLTGGYQPNITAGIGLFQVAVLALMLLASLSFDFHYNLFRLKLRNLSTPEIKFYLKVIIATTIVVSILAWINPFDSLFHVVSMTSSTGVEYINVAGSPLPAKILFILIGLAGGCVFSMAGGLKMQRIQLLFNSVRKSSRPPLQELKPVLVTVIAFAATLLVLSLAFSTVGISLLDSIFEVSSALTTNGISMGATTITLPLGHKLLLIFSMIVGRVEIASIFKAIKSGELLKTFKSSILEHVK